MTGHSAGPKGPGSTQVGRLGGRRERPGCGLTPRLYRWAFSTLGLRTGGDHEVTVPALCPSTMESGLTSEFHDFGSDPPAVFLDACAQTFKNADWLKGTLRQAGGAEPAGTSGAGPGGPRGVPVLALELPAGLRCPQALVTDPRGCSALPALPESTQQPAPRTLHPGRAVLHPGRSGASERSSCAPDAGSLSQTRAAWD